MERGHHNGSLPITALRAILLNEAEANQNVSQISYDW